MVLLDIFNQFVWLRFIWTCLWNRSANYQNQECSNAQFMQFAMSVVFCVIGFHITLTQCLVAYWCQQPTASCVAPVWPISMYMYYNYWNKVTIYKTHSSKQVLLFHYSLWILCHFIHFMIKICKQTVNCNHDVWMQFLCDPVPLNEALLSFILYFCNQSEAKCAFTPPSF